MFHRNRWQKNAIACAVMACSSLWAWADSNLEDGVNAQHQDIEVVEQQQETGEGASRTLGTIVVTATRQEESVMDVPATVGVITHEDMEKHIVNSMDDLIRYQPGIHVKKTVSGTDPFGNQTGFNIRGIGGNRVLMLVDGSRVIESIQDGNRDFVDMSMMKSVEIVRGPGSVLWGADALAGIVSYQTLDPEDLLKGRNAGARISTGYDSLNKASTYTAMVAAQMTDRLQGIAGYTYRTYSEARYSKARADGGIWGCTRIGIGCNELNPLDGYSNNFMAKLVWSPSVEHQIKFTGETFGSDADVKQLYDKYQTSMGMMNSGDYLRNQEQTRWRLGLEHLWLVDAGWVDEVKWQLSYSPQERSLDSERLQRNVRTSANVMTYQQTDYSEDFLQADVQLTSRFDAGAVSHQLTYGFQGDMTESEYKRVTTTNNLKTGSSTTVIGGGTDFSDAKTKRYDFFVQDDIAFFNGQFTVTPGLRWANYKINPSYDATYAVIPGQEPKKISSHELIPQLSLVYKPNQEYSLYGRYAEGFKMPTIQQLYTSSAGAMGMFNMVPNPDLEPETVKSYEIGLRRAYERNWWSIATFYNDYEDFIKAQQHVKGTVNDYTSQNVSKVKIWGIEASSGFELHKDWMLNAGVSYMHGKEKNEDDDGYSPFSDASPITGFLGVEWQSPNRTLSAEFIGNFTGPVTRTTTPDKYKPSGFTIYDAYLNWRPRHNINLSLAAKNIFDKRYFNSNASTLNQKPMNANYANTTPLELYTGAGRTFAANLSVDF